MLSSHSNPSLDADPVIPARRLTEASEFRPGADQAGSMAAPSRITCQILALTRSLYRGVRPLLSARRLHG